MTWFFECTFQNNRYNGYGSEFLLSARKGDVMKVMLFFDGNNFHHGLKEHRNQLREKGESIQTINFSELAAWIVHRVGGTVLVSANYYTGFAETDKNLSYLLSRIEAVPGFFVKRFSHTTRDITCPACGVKSIYGREKEVDTTIAVDIVSFAALTEVDVFVLFSGDADFAPAIEAVHRLGKRAHIATWGSNNVSPRLRNAAYNQIDLTKFPIGPKQETRISKDDTAEPKVPNGSEISELETLQERQGYLQELRRAEVQHGNGYVGKHFFIHRWTSASIDEDPITREQVIERLIREGFIEEYVAPDKSRAIRVTKKPP